MNLNRWSLFWGVILIGGGALALLDQLGYIEQLSPTLWIFVFAAISLFGFVNYALSRWQQWGWLFPAGIFGGLAVTIALLNAGVDNAAVASPLFFGLLIPFAAAYLMDRSRNWWALIPGGIMLFMALLLLLVDNTVHDEWIGSLFLFMVALSFLFVYLNNRVRTWALLVAYITAVLGLAPLMSMGGRTVDYFGALIFFAVALPFFIVYFRRPENWWAIIPAGVLSTLGVLAALAIAGLINNATTGGLANAFLMAGLAATFAVVWLRHHRPWAKIVTIVLGLLAVASAFLFGYYEIFWPVAFICAGIYLLYLALRPKAV
jgi:hypothetical protein